MQNYIFDSMIKHVSKYPHNYLIWITMISVSCSAVDIVQLTCSHSLYLKRTPLHACVHGCLRNLTAAHDNISPEIYCQNSHHKEDVIAQNLSRIIPRTTD